MSCVYSKILTCRANLGAQVDLSKDYPVALTYITLIYTRTPEYKKKHSNREFKFKEDGQARSVKSTGTPDNSTITKMQKYKYIKFSLKISLLGQIL